MSFYINPNPNVGSGGNTPAKNASDITFSKSSTTLSSSNVQGAIKELDDKNVVQDTIITNLQNNQYKIKTNADDSLPDYLVNKIDGSTIQIVLNKIVAKTLDGLTATIGELNYVSGATDNLQNQINALTGGMKWKEELPTIADLESISSPSEGDAYVITSDSNHSNTRTLYVHNGTQFVCLGQFNYVPDATLNTKGAIKLGGDLANPLSTATNPQLTTTGVVAGQYNVANITVDSKGRVTDASSAINDETPSTSTVYSSIKVEEKLESKAETIHNHDISDLTDVDITDREDGKALIWSEEQGKHIYGTVASEGGITSVKWGDVDEKPTEFPPEEHSHDERYYTKQDIDNAGYLLAQPDNETVEVQGGELKARALSGLQLGVAQLNSWLSGTESNIQSQINDILTLISSIGGGLKLRGVVETYADMQQINNMEDGNFVVIISDETKGGGRTWYVYISDLGTWRYMGDLSPSNKFLALTDTPNGYDEGKVLRSSANGLYYDIVRYNEIDGRPDRTKKQIEDAVDDAHEHDNITDLNKVSMNAGGNLVFNGKLYIPYREKEHLYVRRSTSMEHGLNMTLRFDQKISGNIPINENGVFTLTAGRTYDITLNALVDYSGWLRVALVDTTTGTIPPEAPNGVILRANSATANEIPNGLLTFPITPTTTRNFGFRFLQSGGSGTINLRGTYSSFKIVEI